MPTITRQIVQATYEVDASGIKIAASHLTPAEWVQLRDDIDNRLKTATMTGKLKAVPKDAPEYKHYADHKTGIRHAVLKGTIIPGDCNHGVEVDRKHWYTKITDKDRVSRVLPDDFVLITDGRSRDGDRYWNSVESEWMGCENSMPWDTYLALIRRPGC